MGEAIGCVCERVQWVFLRVWGRIGQQKFSVVRSPPVTVCTRMHADHKHKIIVTLVSFVFVFPKWVEKADHHPGANARLPIFNTQRGGASRTYLRLESRHVPWMVQKYSAPCRFQKYSLFTSRTRNPRTPGLLDLVFFYAHHELACSASKWASRLFGSRARAPSPLLTASRARSSRARAPASAGTHYGEASALVTLKLGHV